MNKLEIYKPVKNDEDLGEWILVELRKIVKNCDITFEFNPRALYLRFTFRLNNSNVRIDVKLDAKDYNTYLYPERSKFLPLGFDPVEQARYSVLNIVREFEHELNCYYVRNYYGYAEYGYLPQ